jgi:hypothetical protein
LTYLARCGSCISRSHGLLGCDSNCSTLRAVDYDFFFVLPVMTSSPA